MKKSPSIQHLVENVRVHQEMGKYDTLLPTINLLLKKDPNNSEYLLWKLKALDALQGEILDLNLLQHYVNMRSSDVTGYLLLYKAYMSKNMIADALISLAFALSIDPEDEECLQLIFNLLQEVDTRYKSVKINIMTTDRIGHLSCEIEPLLREQQNNDDCLYIFLSRSDEACNTYLYDLLKNHAHVVEDRFWFDFYGTRPLLLNEFFYAKYPYDLNSSSRGVPVEKISREGFKNLIRIYQESSRLIDLPIDDIALGYKLLADYGITQNDKIVCLHVRDSAYLLEFGKGIDFSYHDFRDADINTYQPAIEYLIQQGYKVVRIGAITNQNLALNSPGFIDLSVNRSEQYGDFLEIFLLSVCDFFLANFSGPYGVAAMFDTPTLIVNGTPMQHPYCKYGRFIPKRLFQNGSEVNLIEVCNGKLLSEESNKEIYLSFHQKEFSQFGYEYIENSPDDIKNAVIEFVNCLDNRILDMNFTENQQAYYDSLPDDFCHKNICVISDSFLTEHKTSFLLGSVNCK